MWHCYWLNADPFQLSWRHCDTSLTINKSQECFDNQTHSKAIKQKPNDRAYITSVRAVGCRWTYHVQLSHKMSNLRDAINWYLVSWSWNGSGSEKSYWTEQGSGHKNSHRYLWGNEAEGTNNGEASCQHLHKASGHVLEYTSLYVSIFSSAGLRVSLLVLFSQHPRKQTERKIQKELNILRFH